MLPVIGALLLCIVYVAQFYRAAMGGEHHKLKKYRFEIMHVYYENKLWALTFFCVSAEVLISINP